eukprot:3775956-Pyramimonas_sp.AAC.1
MRHRKQTQIDKHMDGYKPHGPPDPQGFIMGGDLWSMTRGMDTSEIKRTPYPGWYWEWECGEKNSPIDPCVYGDDWDAIPVGFPMQHDGP